MSVNGITGATQAYDTSGTAKAKANQTKTTEETKINDTESAAVYEKSEESPKTKKIYQRDQQTIDKLLSEAEKRTQSLRDLVQKMFQKQGQTVNESTDIYALLREGKLEVDPETRAQAQKDIAEDGYWGVAQTSDRMVSFAKALTGGDPSKADEMIEAVKRGFKEATKAWGDDLPEISRKTLEATIKKLEAWRDGAEESSAMTDTAKQSFTNQASTSALA